MCVDLYVVAIYMSCGASLEFPVFYFDASTHSKLVHTI